jgi:hypothetical protein
VDKCVAESKAFYEVFGENVRYGQYILSVVTPPLKQVYVYDGAE